MFASIGTFHFLSFPWFNVRPHLHQLRVRHLTPTHSKFDRINKFIIMVISHIGGYRHNNDSSMYQNINNWTFQYRLEIRFSIDYESESQLRRKKNQHNVHLTQVRDELWRRPMTSANYFSIVYQVNAIRLISIILIN